MKAFLTKTVVSFALLTSVAVAPAGAALINRGAFADGKGGFMNLIYDEDRNITWLGDANFAKTSGFDADGKMTWTTATGWAKSLVVGEYTDWRLPTTTQPDPSCANLTSFGFNCTGSEMGHLFYVETIAAAHPDVFDNVQADIYWSGTEFATNTNGAWNFDFNGGYQFINDKNDPVFAWAVRSGDVSAPPAVPEPSTLLLLGSGLVGLIGWRCAQRGLIIR